MNEDFNLIYYHRETGKEYRVKRVTRHDFLVRDPDDETDAVLRLSRYALDKSFRADKGNGKRQKKVRLNFKQWNKDIY